MTQPGPVSIFIAYSRSDAALLDELRKQFAPIERVKKVKVWYDGNIEAGRDWEVEIKQAIYAADIILLLVSADSISSEYFYGKEVEAALERHARGEARVLPFILRSCAWQVTPLGRLQALPKNGWPVVSTQHWPHRDDAWDNAIASIDRIADDITARKRTDAETALAAEQADERQRIATVTEQKRREEESRRREQEIAAEQQRRTEYNAAHLAADQFLQSGRWQQAATAYQNALHLWQPGYGSADALRQRIAACTAEQEAEEHFTRALQFFGAGDYKNALAHADRALRARPGHPRATELRAEIRAVQKSGSKTAPVFPMRNAAWVAGVVALAIVVFFALKYCGNKPTKTAEKSPFVKTDSLPVQPVDGPAQPNSGTGPTNGGSTETNPELQKEKPKFADPFAGQMVRVQGGTFTMGSPVGEDNRDDNECPHPVTVKSFYIGATEVTQAQWRAVMGSDPPELNFKGCDQCPVERVSWNDVQDFIKTLNRLTTKRYRLPTEAQWEYAARGGSKSRGHKYAGSDDLDSVAWYHDNSGKKTHPVRGKKANELGLYDMSGNVWEWCQDLYMPYHNCKDDGCSDCRVLRGGSWYIPALRARLAVRGSSGPVGRGNYDGGFRLAQD